jgi:polyether ionophore transport system permease protein
MIRPLLRAHRIGMLLVTLFGAIILLFNAAGFEQVAGKTVAAREAFAQQIQPVALQITYLLPLPQHLETLGGYLTWRCYGFLGLVFAVWAVLAAAGAARGEEDRWIIDTWLAARVGRITWMAGRLVAFAGALAVSLAICQLLTYAGSRAAGFPLDPGPLAGEGFLIWCLGLAWFGITMLVAQQVPGGGRARAVGAVVLVILFLANSLARSNGSLDRVARFSPFHLYDQSNVLVPGGHLDVAATLLLLAIGLLTTAAAALAFALRDLGAPLVPIRLGRSRAAVHEASRNPLLRLPVVSEVWQWRWSLLFWIVGAAALAGLMDSVAKSTSDLIEHNAPLKALFNATHADPAVGMIAFGWFGIASIGLAVLAVIRTAAWSEEDRSGRLEMELAQPVSRWRVIVERALELGLGTVLIAGIGTGLMVLAASQQNIHLDAGHVVAAMALLVPLALSFGGLGAAISAWSPRLAVGLLAAFAMVEWFIQQFGPLFNWPDAIRNLSIFQLYGQPLVDPVFWNGLWAMIGITLAGFLIAIIAMQRREVGR